MMLKRSVAHTVWRREGGRLTASGRVCDLKHANMEPAAAPAEQNEGSKALTFLAPLIPFFAVAILILRVVIIITNIILLFALFD